MIIIIMQGNDERYLANLHTEFGNHDDYVKVRFWWIFSSAAKSMSMVVCTTYVCRFGCKYHLCKIAFFVLFFVAKILI